ncbi:MAG: cupredoxin domain-containing protein [Gracilimonas sp.]|nr:cupredoxin domain-containing protein [Gracilimonas sp.]
MNTKRIISCVFFLLAVTVSISLIGCSTGSGTEEEGTNGNGQEPSAGEVEMVNTSFSPNDLEVEKGTTVTWTNNSSLTHTVTSGSNGQHDGLFDSGNIAPDGQFSYKFDEVGTFDYYCIPHVDQGMTGTVTVTESSGSGY